MKDGFRLQLASLLLCTAASLSGVGEAAAGASKQDTLEPINRAVFQFNEVSDRWLLRPVAATYQDLTPAPVRKGVGNALRNLRDVNYAVNALLQGRFGDAPSGAPGSRISACS